MSNRRVNQVLQSTVKTSKRVALASVGAIFAAATVTIILVTTNVVGAAAGVVANGQVIVGGLKGIKQAAVNGWKSVQ